MANKIKESDIFDGRIFEQQLKDAIELKSTTEELVKILQKKVSFADPKNSSEVKELTNDLEKLTVSRKILVEQNKIIAEQQKKARQEDKKELDAYQRKSKELNELRKRYKALAVEQGLASKEVKELAKQVDILDKELKAVDASAGQFQRNVGNYTESINEAVASTGLFGSTLNDIKQGLETVKGLFAGSIDDIRANTEAIREQNSIQQKATASAKLFGNALKVGVIGAVIAVGSALAAFFTKFEEGIDTLDQFKFQVLGAFNVIANNLATIGKGITEVFSGIKNSSKAVALEIKLAFLEATNVAGRNAEKIKQVKGEIQKYESEGVSKGIDTIKNAFNDLGTELTKANEDAKALFERIDNFGQTSRLTQRNIELLSGEVAILSAKSADLTLSFKDRENAEIELTDKSTKLLKAREKLALEEFEQQKQRALLGAKFTKEQLNEAIRTQEAGGGITEDLLASLLEFEKEVINIQNEISKNSEDILAQNRSNREKEAKIVLGIIKDNADFEKKTIADISKNSEESFERRIEKQKEFETASKNQLENSIAVFQELTNNQINVDELLSLKATELEERLKQIGLGVKLTGQLNDVLVAYKKDLEEVSAISNKIAEDQEKIRIRNANATQKIEQENFKQATELQKEAFEKQKQNANLLRKDEVLFLKESLSDQFNIRQQAVLDAKEFELQQKGLTEQEKLEIENKYRIESENIERERLANIEKLEEEARQARIKKFEEVTNQITDIINNAVDRQTEIQKAGLDRQIKEREDAVEKAKNGSAQFLAFQEQQLVQAQLKQQQLEEKEQKRKDAIAKADAFIQAYITNLKQPNTTSEKALAKALKDSGQAFALQQVIGGLFSAKDGAEDTGEGGNVDKDKGFLAVLHPHERVLTKEQNAPLLSMGVKNEMIPQLVADGLKYNSMPNIMQSVEMQRKFNSTDVLGRKLDELKKTIENKPYYIDKTDKHGNFERSTVENGMIRTIKYVRSKPRL